MPVLQTHIATDRASRYMTQFCKHAAAMGSGRVHRFRMHGGAPTAHGDVQVTAHWSDTTGSVFFAPWGRADLEAGPDTLLIRLHAVDDEAATRIQTIIGNDLDRFGRKQFTVEWHPVEPACAEGDDPA